MSAHVHCCQQTIEFSCGDVYAECFRIYCRRYLFANVTRQCSVPRIVALIWSYVPVFSSICAMVVAMGSVMLRRLYCQLRVPCDYQCVTHHDRVCHCILCFGALISSMCHPRDRYMESVLFSPSLPVSQVESEMLRCVVNVQMVHTFSPSQLPPSVLVAMAVCEPFYQSPRWIL